MTDKINGGANVGFWSEGAVSFFTITLPAGALNTAYATVAVDDPYVDGTDVNTIKYVPNGTINEITKVITNPTVTYPYVGNVVGMEYTEGSTTVKIALAKNSWTAANLQLALIALGSVTVNKYTATSFAVGVPVTINTHAVNFALATVATSATFVGSAT